MLISIENLSFKTIIGILPFERENKQRVIVDLSFFYKFSKENKEFIDYSEVATLVKKTIEKKKYKLIEDALLDLKTIIKSRYKVKNLKIKISKPDILKDCFVSVTY